MFVIKNILAAVKICGVAVKKVEILKIIISNLETAGTHEWLGVLCALLRSDVLY